MDYITLSELNLTEDDFNVEVVEIHKPIYNNYLGSFSPSRWIEVRVNGSSINYRTSVNVELAKDLTAIFNVNAEEELEKIIKIEAIEIYINSKQYIRKLKLKKINKKYG